MWTFNQFEHSVFPSSASLYPSVLSVPETVDLVRDHSIAELSCSRVNIAELSCSRSTDSLQVDTQRLDDNTDGFDTYATPTLALRTLNRWLAAWATRWQYGEGNAKTWAIHV